MKTRLFYTAKFKSSRLKQFNYNINTSFEELQMNNEIVLLADNQVLRSIRKIKNKDIDFDYVDQLYIKRNYLKRRKENNKKEIKKLQKEINEILYIPEYVTIVIDHKSHYEYMFENGLIINDRTYYRFNSSASQARVSTVVFVCESILKDLNVILDNGRNLNKPLTPSKYNAYKGLSCSATRIVSEPRYCVVPDYFSSLEMEVDFVTETKGDQDDIIERKRIIQDFNRFDGMGLISPEQSKKWAEELDLGYIPAQWCIRQNFMKGMLCTFDIHDFCEKKNSGSYIIDGIYEEKIDLREIDIIITESQFKLWDSFDDSEQYNHNCKENELYWGVSLYTPKEDKDILKMNYQFLQTLNLSDSDIKKICSKFVNWADGVTGEDFYYTLLFLMGTNNTEDSIKKFFKSSDNYWVKCLAICPELINDRYIRKKIFDMVKKKISDACLGNIIIDGNFQVLVADPYAMMEYVCGLEVKGLLGREKYYSNYWNKKSVNIIDSMRAPLTSRSEHLKLSLVKSDETEYWYKYCYTGIILNIHGYETCNFAGSDKICHLVQ